MIVSAQHAAPSDLGALCQKSNAIRGALPSRERENCFDLDQNVGGEELPNLH
jgi:hypothetical protein